MLFSLCGPPGVGKSTLAARAAEQVGWPVLDLDDEIEAQHGCSIPALIEREGVGFFRACESALLETVIEKWGGEERPPLLLSLGGGATVDENQRRQLKSHGVLLSLSVPLEVLLDRLKRSPRPLLPDPSEEKLEALLDTRWDAYRDVHLRLELAGVQVEEDAARLAWALRLLHARAREHTLFLSSGLNKQHEEAEHAQGERVPSLLEPALDYPVYFSEDQSEALEAKLTELKGRLFLVSDESCAHLFAEPLQRALRARGKTVERLSFPGGERAKRLETLLPLYEACLHAKIERRDWIVACGGGITGDVAGLLAATLLRGISWGLIPTSLLAQLDSSVGAKTGVNHALGKNLIGAFYPPRFVWIERRFLVSLDERERRAGWAEALKHGLIEGEPLWSALCAAAQKRSGSQIPLPSLDLIQASVRVKARIVKEDLRERGPRRLLNLGHTIAHAIEATQTRWSHGEAVALGLAFTLRWSVVYEGLPARVEEALLSALSQLGLPREWAPLLDEQLYEALSRDKKLDGGALWYIVVPTLGAAVARRVSLGDFVERAEALKRATSSIK